ncbi:MAG: monovalent cation/H(+) antiporter subunit G [Comamonas sp.]
MNELNLPMWAEVFIAVLVLGGATIALLGSIGLMRLKSYFERVHAPSIIATMGCWLIMWATFVFFSVSSKQLAWHALLIAVFIAVTVPITTIFLMRAALFRARRAGREDVPPSISRIVPNEPQPEEPLTADEEPPAVR